MFSFSVNFSIKFVFLDLTSNLHLFPKSNQGSTRRNDDIRLLTLSLFKFLLLCFFSAEWNIVTEVFLWRWLLFFRFLSVTRPKKKDKLGPLCLIFFLALFLPQEDAFCSQSPGWKSFPFRSLSACLIGPSHLRFPEQLLPAGLLTTRPASADIGTSRPRAELRIQQGFYRTFALLRSDSVMLWNLQKRGCMLL